MKKSFKMLMLLVPLALGITSCSDVQDNPMAGVQMTDNMPFHYTKWIDDSVRPGDSFFRFMYGKWIDGKESSLATQTMSKLNAVQNYVLTNSQDPVIAGLRQLAEKAAVDNTYDMELMGERLRMVAGIQTHEQLLDVFGKLHELGYAPLLRICPFGDERVIKPVLTSEVPSAVMMDYLNMNKKEDALSTIKLVVDRLKQFGFDESELEAITASAERIEKLEMEIYESHLNMMSQMQHPSNRAQRVVSDAMRRYCQLIGFGDYADDLISLDEEEKEQYKDELIGILFSDSETDITDMRNYLLYYILGQDMIYLPQTVKGFSPVVAVTFAMKNAMYYMYRLNTETFGRENIQKEKCTEIMENFRAVFYDRIEHLDWMEPATKQAAQKKLSEMLFFIGYPDEWNDEYTPVVEDSTLLLAVSSMRRQGVGFTKKMMLRSYKDHGWDFWCTLTPFTRYNAMYDGTSNDLIILPAFLITPLFDSSLSEATLYGTAYVFGHEMCHGFDVNGAKRDEYGQLRDWWTANDKAKFQEKQEALVALFNELEQVPGVAADGRKTLPENMADYGGLTLAEQAYRNHLIEQGYTSTGVDIQMKKFWASFGLSVALLESERNQETLLNLLKDDVHSAGHNRVDGMVRLFDDWYRLFDVQSGDKLYLDPERRVKIW
jgi:predicted metalloendopeptidase